MSKQNISWMAFFAAVGLLVGSVACSSGRKLAKTTPQTSPAANEKNADGKDGAVIKSGTEHPAPQTRPTSPFPVLERDDLDNEGEPGKNGGQTSNKDEVTGLLEEALAMYQEAQTALDRGEIDPALTKLDEAYGLILKANTPQDSDLCQEKNDLRILIAQRIQQIYASHLQTAAPGNGTIPLVENKWVLDEIRLFQTRERQYFEEAYKRSGLYRPMIVEELKKAGLPENLSWVPIIESGFKGTGAVRGASPGNVAVYPLDGIPLWLDAGQVRR